MNALGWIFPKLFLGVVIMMLVAGFQPHAATLSEADDLAWSMRCDLARTELRMQGEGHYSSSFAKPAVNRVTVSLCGVRGL